MVTLIKWSYSKHQPETSLKSPSLALLVGQILIEALIVQQQEDVCNYIFHHTNKMTVLVWRLQEALGEVYTMTVFIKSIESWGILQYQCANLCKQISLLSPDEPILHRQIILYYDSFQLWHQISMLQAILSTLVTAVDCARPKSSEFSEVTEVRYSPPYSIFMYSWYSTHLTHEHNIIDYNLTNYVCIV